ncbi:3828_t:CDS:10 [Paraglomus occultum]|uniref:3828_t:CDS:1 n=1 Tax=Paraglomus occultum TaxID=144539 RepID=A0A9N9ABB2_9GLOM|nr:3828_t:CDS:10 [Paraglomus occultum]
MTSTNDEEPLSFFAQFLVDLFGNGSRVPGDTLDNAANDVLLSTQLVIATAIGLTCFLIFCWLRPRWNTLFAPRLRLRGYTPEPLPSSFFGWIKPLLDIPESEILDKVGFDAAVFLGFFRLSSKLYLFCGIAAGCIRIPIWIYMHIYRFQPKDPGQTPQEGGGIGIPYPNDPVLLETEPYVLVLSYAILTWVVSIAVYVFVYYNYKSFSAARQRYYLKQRNTVVARTVMVTSIPKEYQNDKALASYYESLGIGEVESAVVYRHVRRLRNAIEQRTKRLRKTEEAYVKWLGNPCTDENYDPEALLKEVEHKTSTNPQDDPEAGTVNPNTNYLKEERPTVKTGFLGLFGEKVDAIDYYYDQFEYYDNLVKQGRRSAYVPTSVGFVTFANMSSAQIAAQALIYPKPFYCHSVLAPEPRDIYWDNLNFRAREIVVRQVLIQIVVILIIFFWAVPLTTLAALLDLNTLEKYFPWLAHLAERNQLIKGFIQGTLPTLAVTIFNSMLPLTMLYLSRLQGLQARSYIELSAVSKYFFFLLVNVLLVFTVAGTVSISIDDILTEPRKIGPILASTLPEVAPFFVNIVILQGIGMFAVELAQFKEIFPAWFKRLLLAKTPRDYAEASTPPIMKFYEIYPEVVFIFIVCLVYSAIYPSILFFGTIYFSIGFFCYKYLLLYVYFQPYESAGQAWSLIFHRIIIGLYIFQIMMIGFLSLRNDYVLAGLLAPLLFITGIYASIVTYAYHKFTNYIPIQLIRNEEAKDALKKKKPPESGQGNGKATVSSENDHDDGSEQTHCPKGILDDDLYHAAPDLYTDYSQPPMTLVPGILNTGMRRYGPPALVGILPWLWLPIKRSQAEVDSTPGFYRALLGMNRKGDQPMTSDEENAGEETSARHKFLKKWYVFRSRHDTQQAANERIQQEQAADENDPSNPHKTYFHHPERPKPNSESVTLQPVPESAPSAQANDQPSTSSAAVPATDESNSQPRSRDVESSSKSRPLSVIFENWAADNFGDPQALEDNLDA